MPIKDITIVSVYHSATAKRFLELNYALTKKLNPGGNWEWILGDNTHEGFSDKIPEGEKFAKIVRGFDESDPASAPNFGNFPIKKIGCYWHGGSINKVIKHVNTRFMLVLDNNFYVLRKNWLNDAMEHMKKNDLAFFGAPNPPSNPIKYRYFPEVHCIFIDLEKVGLDTLDFMPAYDLLPNPGVFRKTVRSAQKYLEHRVPGIFTKVFELLLANRLRIGRSGDVGARIFYKYGGDPNTRAECIQQIFNPSFLYRLADMPYPDRLSFFPKRKNYYVGGETFLPNGYKVYGERNFETYKWRGLPFGFHIRGHGYGKLKSEDQWNDLFGFLEKAVSKFV